MPKPPRIVRADAGDTPDTGSAGLGYFRVAAAVPPLRVADVDFNLARILELLDAADARSVQLLVFPELSLTGYRLRHSPNATG
jgi:predicted amidohydrolase